MTFGAMILILITRILWVVYPDRCYNEYSDADGSHAHIEQDICDRQGDQP